MKAIVITCTNPTKFVHDEGGPVPISFALNAIPKHMYNQFACVRCNTCLLFIDSYRLVPSRPHKCSFFAKVCRIPHLGQVKLVVAHEVRLSFAHHPSHAHDLIDN